MLTGALLTALVLAQACPPGQEKNLDTAGHCCWPGQAWSKSQKRCVGTPACGAGQRADGEACVRDCGAGLVANEDTLGNCCWPGQAWSKSRAVCVGVPQCPVGFVAVGEGCGAGAAATAAPPVPAYAPPAQGAAYPAMPSSAAHPPPATAPPSAPYPPPPTTPPSAAYPPPATTPSAAYPPPAATPSAAYQPPATTPPSAAYPPPATPTPSAAYPPPATTPAYPPPTTTTPSAPYPPPATAQGAVYPPPATTPSAAYPPPTTTTPSAPYPPPATAQGAVYPPPATTAAPTAGYPPPATTAPSAAYPPPATTPPIGSSAAVASTQQKVDPYSKYGPLDLRMMLIGDPAATPMFGFETGLGINFKRFSAGRVGVSVNLGYLTHPAETYHTRNVFLVGGEAYAGVRLGKSVLELLFRTGLVAAAIHQYDQTLWLPKLHVGSSLFIALTRGGSGLSFGFDVYFLSGASFVPRIGFVL